MITDAGEDLEDLMTLAEADITSKNPEKVKRITSSFGELRVRIGQINEADNLAHMARSHQRQRDNGLFRHSPAARCFQSSRMRLKRPYSTAAYLTSMTRPGPTCLR